jgi:thioredoxin reductase (NADPH)
VAKPIILSVDDESQVLQAIVRDLRQHYGKDYRIIQATSGAEALETVSQLKKRNTPIALFVADQRMPTMTGTEFLTEAIRFYPEARRVLLTAYADTEAAIASINNIGLDYYLLKPWDPPEQNLYPVLDDLLSDWVANVSVPYDGIRVAGTLWSSNSHTVKDFLARNRIPYQWLDIETDSETQKLVEATLEGQERKLPVVFFPNGDALIQPSNDNLAAKIGMRTQASQPFYDLIIVGGGPAGLGAAVYGASEGLRTLMVEKAATGGQAGTSSKIENYLGFPKGLSGADLARRASAQAQRFGTEILYQEVVGIRVDDPYRYAILKNGAELSCHALLIATGVTVRQLSVPGVEPLNGAGVYYGAAVTEAAHYRGRDVFVIGDANSAGQGAMFFSRYANKVTMLVRSSSLEKGMSQYLVEQIDAQENIEVLCRTTVAAVHGSDRLEAITLLNQDTRQSEVVPAAAIFLFIGAVPHTDMVADVVKRNRAGFILTGQDLIQGGKPPKGWNQKRDPFYLETSVPGIFAAGDVRQAAVRRVASAVGEGAISVGLVHQYLKTV